MRALREKVVRRVILTRPAVEAGEKLGFLPGDMKEKLDPYLQPLYDALNDMIPPARLQKFMEEGRSRSHRWPTCAAGRSTTPSSFWTRRRIPRCRRSDVSHAHGAQCQVHRHGRRDADRSAAPGDSGLTRAIGILRGVKGIGVVEFDRRDIVRHELVKHIVEAFDRHGESGGAARSDRS